jgi:hypothetical protein
LHGSVTASVSLNLSCQPSVSQFQVSKVTQVMTQILAKQSRCCNDECNNEYCRKEDHALKGGHSIIEYSGVVSRHQVNCQG